ncbi:hypothetical protein [Escherichia coli]|uniref:hypothetical protein n=1 Tax=Escherichia coli TaxID=562 RepID=UPI001BD2946E|nr:hypothetical protein [Escherichia coli]
MGLKGAELLDFCCDQASSEDKQSAIFVVLHGLVLESPRYKSFLTDIEQSIAPCSACDVLSQLDAVRIPLKALAIKAILVSIFKRKQIKH